MKSIHHAGRTKDFSARYPDYRETLALDRLRAREYSRLDRLGHTYLDYTGGSLYASCQLEAHHRFLETHVLGNPHSHNPTSLAATAWADEARAETLSFFNASPDEYDVVFTPNASGAIKLVGEAYPFGRDTCYLMTYDNHNSVNGVREFASRAGARTEYVRVDPPDLRVDDALLTWALRRPLACTNKLFAYPAQSNFSGVRHSSSWLAEARRNGWDVLYDCAACAPTSPLDLSSLQPDFVPISFYKLFGYPTGIGALVARHEALAKLNRPWFSGGTILIVSLRNGWFHRAPGHMAFEDGTIDYTNLPAVTIGLRYLRRVGLDVISRRVTALTGWLLEEMGALRHSNGRPLVRIFGPAENTGRGATIAFALFDPRGNVYDIDRVEWLAGQRLISLRTGCFCNPGAREATHGLTEHELSACFSDPHTPVTPDECNRRIFDATGTYPSGIRISLGVASDIEDCLRFMDFLGEFPDVPASAVGGALYLPGRTPPAVSAHVPAPVPV